ncbi:cupin domain-containing protein [Sphingomonas canadensis]|uniref:Cupin domain-containing protein n=1 Tax=Sphingomonas canadensis TaxID=1219257 RepID=A0ABW3HCW1_9SPHN|nr:cupin domain-containing protein [Sphingomonas canadensis]MCW3836998.1 cupin domain-containing protein [Sphingomonas canadensis]
MTSDAIRREVLAAWNAHHLAPLWLSPTAHRPPPPPQEAHLWQWAKTRPLLEHAFAETSPEVVERRVLQYLTPYARSAEDEYTVGTMLCCVQCLLPGETARPHRHSMGALRFVLEGSGAQTLVNGKPCPMEYGDLILTPAWCWHEHRHDGDAPVLWLDVLDVPLHSYLGTARFQPGPVVDQAPAVPDAAFAAAGFVPVEIGAGGAHAPVFRYAYADACRAIAAAPAAADGSRTIRYSNPLTGGQAQPFLDCTLTALEAGRPTAGVRSNASIACVVVAGEGRSQIGGKALEWRQKDFFIIPRGNAASHMATGGGAQLFMLSDRDVLDRLGLLEEVPA